MSSWWKGSRIFEQTFDILSPYWNLNTVNGAPSVPTPSTCLNSSFTYALPPQGPSHSFHGPWPLFFCKQVCPLPRCCYWWRSSSGTCCLKLWPLYSWHFETLPLELNSLQTRIFAQESHIIPPRCTPGVVCSRLALLKLAEFESLKYFIYPLLLCHS